MAGPKFTNQMTVAQFDRLFPTDDACKSYLVARRWPHGVRCPRCGSGNLTELTKRPFHWQCRQCSPLGYRFSVLVGTIFENTNIPMRTWFKVIYLMLTSKKGIAALQMHRMFGFGSYSTAHYMCHRIRAAASPSLNSASSWALSKSMKPISAARTKIGIGINARQEPAVKARKPLLAPSSAKAMLWRASSHMPIQKP